MIKNELCSNLPKRNLNSLKEIIKKVRGKGSNLPKRNLNYEKWNKIVSVIEGSNLPKRNLNKDKLTRELIRMLAPISQRGI